MPKKLEEQSVQILLGGELDESIDSRLLGKSGNKVANAQNVIYPKHGTVTKCPGNSDKLYSVASEARTGSLFTEAHYMGQVGRTMVVGGYAEQGSESHGREYYRAGVWHNEEDRFNIDAGGMWAPVEQTTLKIARTNDKDYRSAKEDAVSCVLGEYTYVVWIDRPATGNVDVLMRVHETGTGTIVWGPDTLIDAANGFAAGVDLASPHIIPVNTKVHVFIRDGVNIRLGVVDPTYLRNGDLTVNANLLTVSTPVNDLAAAEDLYDACRVTTGPKSVLVWACNVANATRIQQLNDDGTLSTGVGAGVPEAKEALGIQEVVDYNAGETHLAIAFIGDNAGFIDELCYMTYNASSLAARTSQTSIQDMSAGGDNQDAVQIAVSSEYVSAWEDGDANQVFRVWAQMKDAGVDHHRVRTWRVTLNSGGAGAGAVYQVEDNSWPFHALVSKAWMHKGRSHVVVAYAPDGVLGSSDKVATVATVGHRLSTNAFVQASVGSIHDGTINYRQEPGLPTVTSAATGTFIWPSVIDIYLSEVDGVCLNTVNFNTRRLKPASFNENDIFGCGNLYCFDGKFRDHGFAHQPVVHTATDSGAGAIADGNYTYVTTYEWNDANGNWHVSKPSDPKAVTLGGGSSNCDLEISPLVTGDYDRNSKDVFIGVYRTEVGNATPYRLVNLVENDPTADFVSYTDNLPDASLTGRRQLYTTGGATLANSTPPPCTRVVNHRNRIWAIDSSDPHRLWFTREQADGVAAEFYVGLTLRVPDAAVDLATTPGALVVFCENSIYAITGEGPNDLGVGSPFYVPQVVSRSLGADAGSVEHTDLGVLFEHNGSIYSMSSQMQIQRISDPVKDKLAASSVVTMVQEPEDKRIRYVLANREFLVYDYEHGRWAEWNYRCAAAEDPIQACNYNGDFYLLTDAKLLLDTPTAYALDGYGFNIQMGVETPWISLGALTGLQRIWWANLIGEWVSAHNVVAYLYYDYNSVAGDTITHTCTTSKVPYYLRAKPGSGNQKCSAIKIAIFEAPGGSAARSAEWTAIELVGAFKHGKGTGFTLSG